MPPCPHCNVDVHVKSLSRHVRLCPDNPPVHEAIRECMTDPDAPGVQLSTPRYDARRVLYGVPQSALLEIRYGNWTLAGQAFGLEPSAGRLGMHLLTPSTCPYCGKTFACSVLHRHTATCPEKPELREAILAVMRSKIYPQFAALQIEYREAFSPIPIPTLSSLRKHFGSWRNAVEYYGLQLAPEGELMELREMAKIKAVADHEARLLREDEEHAGAFKVARMRPEPGLRVNGRECVRLELR